jgi:Tfp pilus assembly protein PilO
MMKLILSVAGVALAGGIFFFFTQPHYDTVRALQSEIAQYDQALERAHELQQLKQSLLSRFNAFNPADIDRLHKLLPDHVDNVRLILDLDNLAARHGLAIQNVVISDPSAERNTGGVIASASASRQKYGSLTLKFRTQGTYDSFVAFLNDLEASLRIVDLVSLKLGVETGPQAQSRTEPVYRYDLTIRTYWLK